MFNKWQAMRILLNLLEIYSIFSTSNKIEFIYNLTKKMMSIFETIFYRFCSKILMTSMKEKSKNNLKIMKPNLTMDNLKNFLESSRVNTNGRSGEPFSHVTKAGPTLGAGSYYIPTHQESNFLIAVCNAVNKNEKLTIAEKPSYYSPLRVDFDFKSSLESGTQRKYNLRDLKSLVKLYQNEIKSIINDNQYNDDMLTCIILEKPTPRIEDGKVKDGFHFHFPNFICEASVQDIYIREKVVAKLQEAKILQSDGIITKLEDIIDRDMAKKPWMMYGSMNYKTETSSPYLYNPRKNCGHIFDQNLNEINLDKVFCEEMIGRKNKASYYLPIFLSVRGYDECTPLKPEITKTIINTIFKPTMNKRKIINKNRKDKDVYADLKIITDGHIMEMLSAERAASYNSWIDVGFLLFNISNGKEEGLQMWIEFSQRSPENYKPGECEKIWEGMEVRGIPIGSLLNLALNDNPEEYQRWKNTNKTNYIDISLKPEKANEYDVSMVAKTNANGRFVCADAKHDIWYEFYDHRWHLSDDSLGLKKMLVHEVIEDYIAFIRDIGEGLGNIENRTRIELQQKRAWAIVNQLKSVSFHRKVIEMCKLHMTDNKFLSKIDENKMLFCCDNGVLDLEMGIFRDGRPDDYCSKTSEQYFREYEEGGEEDLELEVCLTKFFPNPRLKDYYEDMCTSCMQGGNISKRIFICTGEPNGGKTAAIKLAEKAFGEHFGKFPRELFLKGRPNSSAAARPELSQVPGKKIMSTQEITHNDDFDIGFLKECSGGDSIWTRGMYTAGGRIFPQYTAILQCNKPPRVPGDDEATWSRIRLLDFESKFVISTDLETYPVPETFEEQVAAKRFHADTDFSSKIGRLSNILLWRIFKNFAQYKIRGLREPKEVMISTKNYRSENDVYQQFFDEKIIKVPISDENTEEDVRKKYITKAVMFSTFKDWYAKNYRSYNRGTLSATDVTTAVIKKTGLIKNEKEDIYGFGKMNRFYGYQINYDMDDADDIPKMMADAKAQ